MKFRARQFEFRFPAPAILMGIVNVTPDSFFDGGQYYDTQRAVAHALELVAEGAGILDVGGESTRPQAAPVSEAEEMRRVLPVIERLVTQVAVPISIDTCKPAVARAAVAAGAAMINDIAANREDGEMWRVAAETGAGYVAMHMQGSPPTMQLNPNYDNVVQAVQAFFGERLERLQQAGMHRDQIVLDVGIGFGKTLEHNLQLLAALDRFTTWERPLLLGVSRKSFIGKLLGVELASRLPGGLACACRAIESGVTIIRTHDVAATWQAVRMTEALLAHKTCD
ncbi:MAG: dihydropteroate synthase [Verrucomicrobiota bacterium]